MLDRENITKKYENVAETRSSLLELQQRHMEEEKERRIKEHACLMKNLELQRTYMENEERRKENEDRRKEEEHNLKMKLLKIQINKIS